MIEEAAIKASLDQWLAGLDGGDLEKMVAVCDPEIVVCNQGQPTGIGLQAIREKYGPRIEAAMFKSGFDLQHINVLGDFALVVGRFTVEVRPKGTDAVSHGEGRLVLNYRRYTDGRWKVLLDVDNNDETDVVN